MNKNKNLPITALNDHDRLILNKYTGFYTNFIESSTAKTEMFSKDMSKTEE